MVTQPVNDTVPFIQYDAALGQDTFDFPWWIREVTDLQVYIDGVLTVDYSVTGAQETDGGQIVLDTPLVDDAVVTIASDFPFSRLSGFATSGSLRAAALNLELSYLVACILQLDRDQKRSLKMSITSQMDPDDLVLPEAEDDKTLAWDGTAGAMKNGPSVTEIVTATAQTAADKIAAQAAAAAAAQAYADIVALNLAGGDGIWNVLAKGVTGDGVTDDTAAFQAALTNAPEGSIVLIPGGKTYKLTDGLTVDKRLTLLGNGLLNFTAGITNKAALSITANGCKLIGLRMDNPNKLQSSTGGRNYGVQALANEVTVECCTIEHFQNGIAVSAGGEYENIIIANNRIKDCIGAGGGRGSGSSQGEDRGDGIVVWGTQATVVGNIVNAEAGQDCRIGIHGEALDTFAGGPPPTGYYHSLMTFTGNVVYGQFRRSLVFEGIDHGVIANNSCADATWWGIALAVGNKNCVVANNSIMVTRTSADDQGSTWSPDRAGMSMYGKCYDCIFIGNTIRIRAGATIANGIAIIGVNSNKTITGITNANPGVVTSVAHGLSNGQRIMLLTASAGVVELRDREFLVANKTNDTFELTDLAGTAVDTTAMGVYTSGGTIVVNVPTRTKVENNIVSVDGGVLSTGIYCPYSYDTIFRANTIHGPLTGSGAYLFNPIRCTFDNNRITLFNDQRALRIEGTDAARITNNVIHKCGTAIQVSNGSYHTIQNNYIEDCTYAVDIFGTTYSSITNNGVKNATSGTVNNYGTTAGATANVYRNNSWQMLLATQSWDVGSLVDGAREQFGSDITVTGAALGDRVMVTANIDPQGIKLVGWVSSANTVRIAAENETGSTINLASATYYITVDKRV